MAIHEATRRELLAGSGALFAWAFAPKLARAEGRDPRFLTIVLRGALDGLAAVAPVGDPDWIKLRGDKALKAEGNAALALDEFYALNPAMPTLHRLYRAGQAIVVHAAATPYRVKSYFAEVAGAAGKVLASADGPRVGALALDGWDTHANEGAVSGRLANLLGALDGALAAIEQNMGPAWQETVVALITEFGRTARINGTDGTDHGTATVALLVGGALKGGRVIADWPGLKEADLHEKRDLRATIDLRAVLKGLLRDHLRAEDRVLAADVFPGSGGVMAMEGLVG